jgi:hypothetical protein
MGGKMKRILFGDNQFFGVNHMSEEKARQQGLRFQDDESIIDVLETAYGLGIHVFMCTTHDRIAMVCDHIRANRSRFPLFEFYPCMPYAHKYANAVTEDGVIEALRRFLPKEGAIGALLKGGMSIASKDMEGICQLLVDAEMKMFDGLPTPVIFLQNVVTDLLLGLQAGFAFHVFADHVKRRYNAEAGFITMNMPKLLDFLDQIGIDNPIVCANINKSGFRMCGGIESYELAIAGRRFRPIAMSVLASGSIDPREAIDYVCRQTRIESIVFGASSRANIAETKRLIEEATLEYASAEHQLGNDVPA